jgi:predicted phage terminase large subunit-like protein
MPLNIDKLTPKEALEAWKKHCETVQDSTVVNSHETQAQKSARIKKLLADYNAFVEYYFPHYTINPQTGKPTACAPFQIKAANDVLSDRNFKGVAMWHRGAAKSTHMDIFIPMWLKAQAWNGKELRQFNVMVLVGKSEDNANTLLADVQAELQYNQRYIADFGQQYNSGSWQDGEFVTKDGTAFFARGRGQSPRGLRYRSHRPDYIVIDDLDDDELCESPARVTKLTDWVLTALYGALDGGRGRFIMVGNLIAKNSVLANIAAIKSFKVTKVNIIDSHGNVSWAAKWSIDEVRTNIQQVVGYRRFQKEYMNNPIVEGAVFRQDWIRWAKRPAWKDFTEIVLYIDPAWKSTTKNDYKAAKLWGKTKKTQLWHLRAFVRQATVAEMIRWCYDLYEWAQDIGIAIKFYMEANFMQDALLDDFTTEGELRGYQLPIIGDKRKKPDKFLRIESIAPLWERGFVFYDDSQKDDPDMLAGLDQTLAFQRGMRGHDDAPDADEGALSILQKHSRITSFEPSFGRRRNAKNVSW